MFWAVWGCSGEGGYHTQGLGYSLRASAPKEEAISERRILVKCNSNAPIICFETSKALLSYQCPGSKKDWEFTTLGMDDVDALVVALIEALKCLLMREILVQGSQMGREVDILLLGESLCP